LAVVNDPEASGFDTGAASDVEIAHPDAIVTLQLALLVLLFPAAGHASDMVKTADRRVKVMFCGAAAMLVGSVPIFEMMLLEPSTGMAFFMQTCFSCMLAAIGGPMAAWFVEAFPPMVRYSGVGMGYNFSQAVFGGSAPLIATALIGQGLKLGPMFWVSFVSLVAIGGQFFARKAALAGDTAASLVATASADPTGSPPAVEGVENPTAAAQLEPSAGAGAPGGDVA